MKRNQIERIIRNAPFTTPSLEELIDDVRDGLKDELYDMNELTLDEEIHG